MTAYFNPPPKPNSPAPTARRRRRWNTAFTVGGITISALAVGAFLLLLVCAAVLAVAVFLAGTGTARHLPLLQGLGIIFGLLSFFGVAVMVPTFVVLSWSQIVAFILHFAAFRSARGDSRTSRFSLRRSVLSLIGMVMSATIFALFLCGYYAYARNRNDQHNKLAADYILRIEGYVTRYGGHEGRDFHFAPSLAAADVVSSNQGLFEMLLRVPDGTAHAEIVPFGVGLAASPKYASAVDEASDFRYIGGDLPMPIWVGRAPSPMVALAPRIVVLYDKHSWGGGRVVAFANGTERFVSNADLSAIFADTSSARAALGLPPVTLDGPAPLPASTR